MSFSKIRPLLGLGVLLLLTASLNGCVAAKGGMGPGGGNLNSVAKTPVTPVVGGLVAMYQGPLQTDFNGSVRGSKRGEAQSLYIRDPFTNFLSVAFDDASIADAMHDGGITTLTHLDYKVVQVLGLFGSFTVIAYGE